VAASRGPGWSSVIVIRWKVLTQEQRGEQEATVCYDAANGEELWAHTDDTRFFERWPALGRGAPDVCRGPHLYSWRHGEIGLLRCRDRGSDLVARYCDGCASDGDKKTTPPPAPHGDSRIATGADGLVIVFAGGENNRICLLTRPIREPAWVVQCRQRQL